MLLRKPNNLKEKLDSPESFYFWLESKDPDDIIGTPCSARSCLLAKYFNENSKYEHSVTKSSVLSWGGYGTPQKVTYHSQPWIETIINVFDINFVRSRHLPVKIRRHQLDPFMGQIAEICGVRDSR